MFSTLKCCLSRQFKVTVNEKAPPRPAELESYFFVERDEKRALERAQSPFGAPVKYDLFDVDDHDHDHDHDHDLSETGKKLAYRDAVFRLQGPPQPQRMSATETSVRPVLGGTRLSKGDFEVKMLTSRREGSGRESLLILGRRPDKEDRLLTFVDWGKEEEKVLWEVEIPGEVSKYSRRLIFGEEKAMMVRLLIGDGFVGMLSTIHNTDEGYWGEDWVCGQVLSMRLRLFTKEDGHLFGDDEIDPTLGEDLEFGDVLGRAGGGNVLALCCIRDWDMDPEDGAIGRILCYVYDAAAVLRRRGGGRDKSIPRRKVSLRHPLLWKDGVGVCDVKCSFRCGSILVLYMRNGALSLWDLGSCRTEAILLSTYELNDFPMLTLSRDGKAFIFHEDWRNTKEKYLVITLHKSLGVLGDTT